MQGARTARDALTAELLLLAAPITPDKKEIAAEIAAIKKAIPIAVGAGVDEQMVNLVEAKLAEVEEADARGDSLRKRIKGTQIPNLCDPPPCVIRQRV